MPDLAHWTWFLASSFVLLVTPGPSILYVVARGIAQGWRAAVCSAVGLAIGDFLQVVATALGLSGLLTSAPRLFLAMKLSAGLYLVFLGAATLVGEGAHGRARLTAIDRRGASSPRALIAQGILAWNPKTALFLLAFLPQFIDAEAGPAGVQILALGSAFVGFGLLTNSVFGGLGAKLGTMAARGPGLSTAMRYASGSVLIAVGIAAIVAPALPSAGGEDAGRPRAERSLGGKNLQATAARLPYLRMSDAAAGDDAECVLGKRKGARNGRCQPPCRPRFGDRELAMDSARTG